MLLRKTALELLTRIEKENSFSHLLISETIDKSELNIQDENLLVEIVYGTIERKLTLNYYLSPFINQNKKMDAWILTLLQMSVYQMEFLNKVPDYAIINEAVEIAKHKGHRGTGALVNGILRSLQRKGVPNLDSITDKVKRLSIETSHPEWLVKLWISDYGFETAKNICESNLTRKPMTIRAQILKNDRKDLLNQLANINVEAKESSVTKQGVIIESGNVIKTSILGLGNATIQDESSMLVTETLNTKPGMEVLDCCSAPGGKTTHIAEIMGDKGRIVAHDLHKNKIKLVKNHADRLNLSIIEASPCDARNLTEIHEKESFDRILVDAPCSGLGVIRSKPDIKYNKSFADIEKLQTVQQAILEEAFKLLKKDGQLVYSTCTINILENEHVIEEFLNHHPEVEVDSRFIDNLPQSVLENSRLTDFGIQLFPYTANSDAFFISRLKYK
ncbi:MAG TPA: 16S rRNA (cytosine(967)-C(5))-methyltransferase RsmB [Pseudogracilibacillus sp.]|nr:16S rRNA (cytosine(967)-C(5))-methyltransferase RsmB [Pseudogracilibacillus sp.]